MRVAVDYHNTLEVWNKISLDNIQALKKLQRAGYQVFLCSFCGWNREQEVKSAISKLDFQFDGMKFCRDRVGENGKAEWCTNNHIGHIFDDSKDICEESLTKGLEVWPIQTRHEEHKWAHKSYQSFCKAVHEFFEIMATRDG